MSENETNADVKWPQLSEFFKQIGKNTDKNIKFNCLLCVPIKCILTSQTSYSNLRSHIKVRLSINLKASIYNYNL